MKNSQGKIKTILLSAMTIFALFSTMSAVFAWFVVVNPSTKIDTVTGDMSISLKKLSAIKYVYPFYPGSNDFIDYSSTNGKLKTYVLNDSDSTVSTSFDKETIPSIDTTGFTPASNSCYLVGDSVFLGTNETPYSLSSGIILNSSADGNTFSVKSVSLSVNSTFLLTDKGGRNLVFSNVTYFKDNKVTNLDDDILNKNKTLFLAKKAGFYDFTITKEQTGGYDLTITSQSRDDASILGMTLFDPTYAKLYGMKEEEAIYKQNTCLVYDVKISVKNEMRDFLLNLQVKRKALEKDNGETRKKNQYCLSKYISFKAAMASEINNQSIQSIYDFFHNCKESPGSFTYNFDWQKFDTEDQIALVTNKKISSTSETSTSETTPVHLYLAVDYDPENMKYFFDESKLGNSYDLIRDFTFYFSTVQSVATEENTNNA